MKDSNGDSNGDDDDVKRCVAAVQPDWPVTGGPKSELDILPCQILYFFKR